MTKTDRHAYDSGIIGNCAYIAHVDRRSNVSWLCWPYFDSPCVFGGLLDPEKTGEFSIEPDGEYESRQYYLDNTNILCTEFTCSAGRYRVLDFAPRFPQFERMFKPYQLFRKIEVLEGIPKIRVRCKPTYNYGELQATATPGSNHIAYQGLGIALRLTGSLPLSYILNERSFVLTRNHYLVLSYANPLEAPLESVAEEFLKKTTEYWRGWVRYSTIDSFEQKAVIRSCLALKLHQFEDTGAIIAASTTSLPESPGSGRTWDYRYCWIRDTYYTLSALRSIGHGSELEGYAQYIQNITVEADGRYCPVYSIRGQNDLPESVVDLEGYQGNQPVRVGNQAVEHVQNDVYGQILVSLLPLIVDDRFSHLNSIASTQLVFNLLGQIEKTMDEPDAGLWEFRNAAHLHCYTFLFHWIGSQAARRIGQYFKDDQMIAMASKLIEQSAERIERCYDSERGVYTSAIGFDALDASLLQLITLGYLDPESEKARKHLQGLEAKLKTENGLFYRYLHEDDFGKPHTTFLICSFWYIEALAAVGRTQEAIDGFRNLLGYGNHLGLLSEDVDNNDGSQWGNFPQTYSHVGLMNAASRIARRLDRPDFLW
ncbi:MAG: glycoside hydrolase family 15 protein [bacterium]|nr:glycoside hydrolase family 15 protein [bacterium]